MLSLLPPLLSVYIPATVYLRLNVSEIKWPVLYQNGISLSKRLAPKKMWFVREKISWEGAALGLIGRLHGTITGQLYQERRCHVQWAMFTAPVGKLCC